jgi:ADP-ribosylglycohydrolase
MPETQKDERVGLVLLGAVAGDIIGSVHEYDAWKEYDFPLFGPRSKFTDDSVLTLAIAEAIVSGRSYLDCVREFAPRYPRAGYGGMFRAWMASDNAAPYNSYGNGSAMRVSPVGWAFDSVEEVLREAEASAAITHNHPEGIKGAQATALAVYMARTGADKKSIKGEIEERFGYDLDRTVDGIRPGYKFDVTCMGTVPEAVIAFLDSEDFEDAVRKAVSLGGDADTLAAITGAIAEAFYGAVPREIASEVEIRLPAELWVTVEVFSAKYGVE